MDPPYEFDTGSGAGAFGTKRRNYRKEYISLYHEKGKSTKDTEWLMTLFIIKPEKYKTFNLEDILKLETSKLEEIRNYNINYAKYILEKGKNRENSFTYTSSRSYKVPNTNIKSTDIAESIKENF